MLIYVAGIGNSGEDHWQRQWHRQKSEGIWIEHASWDHPKLEEWVRDIAETVERSDDDVVLVAHSLGCLAVLEWATSVGSPKLAGVFLVSVPDPAGPEFPTQAEGFSDRRFAPLHVPTVVVSSSNDVYGSSTFHASVSEAIGAALVEVGPLGHINAASQLGSWDQGWTILEKSLLVTRS